MSIPLTIQIGNKEYNVIGENETLIRQAADHLNEKMSKSSNDNIQPLTKITLAALNIAENEIRLAHDWNISNKDITNEIHRIANFIETNINNPHF